MRYSIKQTGLYFIETHCIDSLRYCVTCRKKLYSLSYMFVASNVGYLRPFRHSWLQTLPHSA